MPRSIMGVITVFCAALLFSSVTFGQMRQAKDVAAKDAVAAPAPEHDLSGVWLITSRAQGLSKTPPPFTDEGKARYEANKPGFGPRAVAGGNDPINHCDPMGVPRSLLTDQAMQFVQIPGRTVQFIEWNHTWRDLWTDGRQLPKDPDPKWFGTSVGKWQGDTFVVETVGVDERTWLDSLGFPHSDAMHLEERYRRVDRDTIELTVTLDDPVIYAKPWVSDKKVLKLQPKQELGEAYCVGSEWEAFNERMRDPAMGK
jgi:hypothetical protein